MLCGEHIDEREDETPDDMIVRARAVIQTGLECKRAATLYNRLKSGQQTTVPLQTLANVVKLLPLELALRVCIAAVGSRVCALQILPHHFVDK